MSKKKVLHWEGMPVKQGEGDNITGTTCPCAKGQEEDAVLCMHSLKRWDECNTENCPLPDKED